MMPGPRAKGVTTVVAVFKICKHSALIGTPAWSVIIEALSRFIKASFLCVVLGIAIQQQAVVLDEDRMPGKVVNCKEEILTLLSTAVKSSRHMGIQVKEIETKASAVSSA